MIVKMKNSADRKIKKQLQSFYKKGYLDGEKNIIKNLFTLEIITIEKIAEISTLSIDEIKKLTKYH